MERNATLHQTGDIVSYTSRFTHTHTHIKTQDNKNVMD